MAFPATYRCANKSLYFLAMMIVFSSHVYSQDFQRDAQRLTKALADNHISPRPIDEKLSNDIFERTLDLLDPQRVIFSQADISSIQKYKTGIGRELKGESWQFTADLSAMYLKLLGRARNNIGEILASPLDFSKEEFFDRNAQWSENESLLKNRQRQWVKYETLDHLHDLMARDSVECNQFKNKLPDAISRFRLEEVKKFERWIASAEERGHHVAMMYFDAITGAFDPHSKYMSPSSLRNFISHLATDDYQFGFSIDENEDGQVVVTGLAPGSPAWNSGELHVSDEIVSVKKSGGKSVDIQGTVEKANEVLSGAGD
jgi:carboxyl-terminal processing protease